MKKMHVPGLPSVSQKIWDEHLTLLHMCRTKQNEGFKDGDDQYETVLTALKQHAKGTLLLGHTVALEEAYARKYKQS